MTEKSTISLPAYEALLAEAGRSLAIDGGMATSPVEAGGNALVDGNKSWAVGVHRNRLVKIISGSGAGQLVVIEGNSSQALVIRGTWEKPIFLGSAYVILDRIQYSGRVYENASTAADDDPRRFEEASKKLNDVVIAVETNDQLFGSEANQRVPVTAGSAMGFTRVDLATLWFKNRNAGQNGTVYILGVEE